MDPPGLGVDCHFEVVVDGTIGFGDTHVVNVVQRDDIKYVGGGLTGVVEDAPCVLEGEAALAVFRQLSDVISKVIEDLQFGVVIGPIFYFYEIG